ncbi:hypothetical protein KR093_010219 [Drosophila rubida]|uniref:DUF4777 domain-containing protein n=1 Tax=Drosophila rubida TaxID=30044 RepID=A0AAD4PSW6_9MUSC|nr:hypothetical protein KR093_010219 [Drosophila rubida]
MSRYRYSDLILEAFMEFRRPMAMDEVVEYVAEMTDRPLLEVRLPVDNTLTAAWLHGFVERENDLYTLRLPDFPIETAKSRISSAHLRSSNINQKFEWCSLNQRRRCKRL